MKPLLSVCMIVKDEAKVLRRCLESIHGIADEIVIADTGSTDQTKAIAEEYTNYVYDFEWVHDFAAARNFAASKAIGQWILVIDADEYVDRKSFQDFKQNLKENPPDHNIIAVKIMNFTGLKGERLSENYHDRLYKNDQMITYTRSIHEVLKHEAPELASHGYSDLKIFHTGYTKETVQEKNKSDRNLEILLQKENKEAIDYFYLGNEFRILKEYDKAILNFQKSYSFKPDLNAEWVKRLLIYLTDTLYRANQIEAALELVTICEDTYPHIVDFKFLKGLILYDEKKYSEAQVILENILLQKDQLVIEESTNFLEVYPYELLAEIYKQNGDLNKAVKSYSKAASLNPADNSLWVRLLHLLAEHSPLEEFSNFLNAKILSRTDMSHKRVIQLLLAIPILDVQKLTRSFLASTEIEEYEREAVYLKNILLDKDYDVLSGLLNEKPGDDVFHLLHASGIFTLADFLVATVLTDDETLKVFLENINYDTSMKNLYKLLFEKSKTKLNETEKQIFTLVLNLAVLLEEKTLEKTLKNLNLSSKQQKSKTSVMNRNTKKKGTSRR